MRSAGGSSRTDSRCHPTRRRAAAIASSSGRRPAVTAGPKPHRLTSGPTVGSNAPPVRSLKSSAARTTLAVSAETGTQSGLSVALNADNSESGR